MTNIITRLHLFLKFSTSLILIGIIVFLLYLFYISYRDKLSTSNKKDEFDFFEQNFLTFEKSINGKVVYCTNLPWLDAMKLLKSSSVLVVPSRMESLPTNIKEAFFLKIPVVGINVGGIPELITHNKTGILVPPEDSKKLVTEINNILNDKRKYDDIVQNAYDFVINQMSWKKIIPEYIKFYENLLKDKSVLFHPY